MGSIFSSTPRKMEPSETCIQLAAPGTFVINGTEVAGTRLEISLFDERITVDGRVCTECSLSRLGINDIRVRGLVRYVYGARGHVTTSNIGVVADHVGPVVVRKNVVGRIEGLAAGLDVGGDMYGAVLHHVVDPVRGEASLRKRSASTPPDSEPESKRTRRSTALHKY